MDSVGVGADPRGLSAISLDSGTSCVKCLTETGRTPGVVASATTVYSLTLILVESMAAYVGLRSTFDRAPDDIDDDRYVEASVELAADTLERAAGAPVGESPALRGPRSR